MNMNLTDDIQSVRWLCHDRIQSQKYHINFFNNEPINAQLVNSWLYCSLLNCPYGFDAIASSSGSSYSVPTKLLKYVNAVLVRHFKTLLMLRYVKIIYQNLEKLRKLICYKLKKYFITFPFFRDTVGLLEGRLYFLLSDSLHFSWFTPLALEMDI